VPAGRRTGALHKSDCRLLLLRCYSRTQVRSLRYADFMSAFCGVVGVACRCVAWVGHGQSNDSSARAAIGTRPIVLHRAHRTLLRPRARWVRAAHPCRGRPDRLYQSSSRQVARADCSGQPGVARAPTSAGLQLQGPAQHSSHGRGGAHEARLRGAVLPPGRIDRASPSRRAAGRGQDCQARQASLDLAKPRLTIEHSSATPDLPRHSSSHHGE
jgi:hypothetical protein